MQDWEQVLAFERRWHQKRQWTHFSYANPRGGRYISVLFEHRGIQFEVRLSVSVNGKPYRKARLVAIDPCKPNLADRLVLNEEFIHTDHGFYWLDGIVNAPAGLTQRSAYRLCESLLMCFINEHEHNEGAIADFLAGSGLPSKLGWNR